MNGAFRLERARRLLTLPEGWIETAADGRYHLRTGRDRRARVMMRLDEADLRALIETPGLRARDGGGWRAARPSAAPSPAPPPGRPGVVEGTRIVMSAEGQAQTRRANLAVTAVAWLARRRDRSGRPWLSKAEIVAADRLTRDAEAASSGAGLTMRWDALPRRSAGSGTRREPADAALAAGARVEAALAACGADRAMVRLICVEASALAAAERDLGLRRRTGRTALKRGLAALARHYGPPD